MLMDVVADCLNAAPSRRSMLKKIPRRRGQPVGFTIPTPEQVDERVLRQVLHRNLLRLRNNDVRDSGVVDERIGRDAHAALRSNDAGAPVAEVVTIGCHRDRRVDHQAVTPDEIGHTREVDVEVEDHRGWLRAVVDHFETDMNLHHKSPISAKSGLAWLARWVVKRFVTSAIWRGPRIMGRSGSACHA